MGVKVFLTITNDYSYLLCFDHWKLNPNSVLLTGLCFHCVYTMCLIPAFFSVLLQHLRILASITRIVLSVLVFSIVVFFTYIAIVAGLFKLLLPYFSFYCSFHRKFLPFFFFKTSGTIRCNSTVCSMISQRIFKELILLFKFRGEMLNYLARFLKRTLR